MKELAQNIEDALIKGDQDEISDAIFEYEYEFIQGDEIPDSEVSWVISKIESLMENDVPAINTLVNIFQNHWSKLSSSSQKHVLEMCEKYIDICKNPGAQTAMGEIMNGEYLH